MLLCVPWSVGSFHLSAEGAERVCGEGGVGVGTQGTRVCAALMRWHLCGVVGRLVVAVSVVLSRPVFLSNGKVLEQRLSFALTCLSLSLSPPLFVGRDSRLIHLRESRLFSKRVFLLKPALACAPMKTLTFSHVPCSPR